MIKYTSTHKTDTESTWVIVLILTNPQITRVRIRVCCDENNDVAIAGKTSYNL